MNYLEKESDGSIVLYLYQVDLTLKWLHIINKYPDGIQKLLEIRLIVSIIIHSEMILIKEVDTCLHLLLKNFTLPHLPFRQEFHPHLRVHDLDVVVFFGLILVHERYYVLDLQLDHVDLAIEFYLFSLDVYKLLFESVFQLKDLIVFFFQDFCL